MPYIDAQEVKRKANGRWEEIVRKIAPALNDATDRIGKHVKCPVHQGKTEKNFRLYPDFKDSGGGACNSCGRFADGFALLTWVTGAPFKEILADVADIVGGVEVNKEYKAPPPPPKVDHTAEDKRKRDAARWVYSTSVPMDRPEAEPARRYLASRGFKIIPPNLRCHPALRYRDDDGNTHGPFPAIIAVIVDPKGKGVTLHRTYLSYDGKKAPVPGGDVKKIMGVPSDVSLQGAAIRLFPAGPVLGVSEGIETAIAATEATGIPTWPVVSAQFMAAFIPPPGVERVIVFADKNRPTKEHPGGHGQESGKQLVANLWAMGKKAVFALPPSPIPDDAKDVDWCDEYVRNGREAFKSIPLAA